MSSRSISVSIARRLVLALSVPLLLLAQHGAWLHSLSHLERPSLASTGQIDSEHDRQTGKCQLCLAFVSFDGGVQPTVMFVAPSAEAATAIGDTAPFQVVRFSARGYLSRAPPDLA